VLRLLPQSNDNRQMPSGNGIVEAKQGLMHFQQTTGMTFLLPPPMQQHTCAACQKENDS
jgi:hypothetical protein